MFLLTSMLLDNYKVIMEDIRIRKVDVTNLSEEDLIKLEKAIGDKIAKIINKANEEANRVLDVYGMETRMVMEIKEKNKAV